jgi:hypothetical protein
MTRQRTQFTPGLAVILMLQVCVAAAWAVGEHPHLVDVPANREWLAPAGTGHLQNVRALDPGQPADVVINRDKVLGRSLQIAVATDARMLMLVHGETRLPLTLSGRPDTPHMLELRGQPAEVRLDDRPAPDPMQAWDRMMQINGDHTLTLRFVGATRLKLQFDADQTDPRAAATFFGIPVDPSNPGYQRLSRQQPARTPPATPTTPQPNTVPPPDTTLPPAAPVTIDRPNLVAPTPPTPKVVTEFPSVTTSELLAKVQPATVRIEARLGRAGVTAVAHGFFVNEDGLVLAPLDAIADAADLRVVHGDGTGERAELVAVDTRTGLALLQTSLSEGAKVKALKLAALPPARGVPAWLVTLPVQGAKQPAFSEGSYGEPIADDAGLTWCALRCVTRPEDVGAVLVNPLGEAVAMTTWQWHRAQSLHQMLALAPAQRLINATAETPPTLVDTRRMRTNGALPGLVPAWLRIDTTQPAAAVQRDAINLKRNFACRVCDGKGEVDKQVHRQTRGNVGAGRDWFETVKVTCPTCQGGRLGAPDAIARLIEKLADTLATGDTSDTRWVQMRDFAAQTLDEVVKTSPQTLLAGLRESVGRVDPASLRVGQTAMVVGRIETMREPAMLLGPDCAYIKPDAGPGVLLVGGRLTRARAGETALAAGLFAGMVRMPDGQMTAVFQNGLTYPLPGR